MNHRANPRRIFRTSAVCFLAAAMSSGSLALGQAAPAAPGAAPAAPAAPPALPVLFPPTLAAAKTAPKLDANQTAGVTNYINTAVRMLETSRNAEQVRQTRSNLENAAIVGPGQAASADYERVFTTALSNAVVKAMANRDVRARTAVAAAVYRVAMRTKHPGLAAGVKAMLQDRSEAVASWAAKIARVLYPALLVSSPNDAAALAPLMVGALRMHYRSPAIAEDVFEGISGDATLTVIDGLGVAGRPAIDSMISLLQARAQLFENAVPGGLPEAEASKFPAVVSLPRTPPFVPAMEVGAANYLALKAKRNMTPQQQAAAGRALYDLTAQMIRLAPSLPPAAAASAPEIRQQDLASILGKVAAAIRVYAAEPTTGPARAIQQLAGAQGLDEVSLGMRLTELEKEMTDAKLLGPKPAAAPAPATPAPAAPATPTPSPRAAPAAQRPAASGTPTLNK